MVKMRLQSLSQGKQVPLGGKQERPIFFRKGKGT